MTIEAWCCYTWSIVKVIYTTVVSSSSELFNVSRICRIMAQECFKKMNVSIIGFFLEDFDSDFDRIHLLRTWSMQVLNTSADMWSI